MVACLSGLLLQALSSRPNGAGSSWPSYISLTLPMLFFKILRTTITAHSFP